MSPVAAPVDKHFRRAHVKPARKRRDGRRLGLGVLRYGLLAGVVVYGGYRAWSVVADARVLSVDRIVVRGNGRLSSGEVLALLDGLRGESLIWTDLNLWRRRLTASPWVKDAALRRRLPSTVEVVISERQPIGIGRVQGEMFLVDETGALIDEYGPRYADLDLPTIDGLQVDGESNEARSALAARLLHAVRASPELARRVSQIDVSDPHDAVVLLAGDSVQLRVGDDQFAARLESYLDLAAALRERVPDIDYVDLRFGDRVYVRPVDGREGGASSSQ